jgi:type I restriction enzyme R subunit
MPQSIGNKRMRKGKAESHRKTFLRQYGYPPDLQMLAKETIHKQAEWIANEPAKE